MEDNNNNWQESMITQLEEKIADFPEQKKAFIHDALLKKVISLVPSKVKSETDLFTFQEKIEGILRDMPKDRSFKLKDIRHYRNRVNSLKMYLNKKYQLVTKGYYISVFLPIGLAIGMPLGLLFDNLALGPAFGLPIGIMIGGILEARAKKEGRII